MARIYIGRATGIGSFERHVVLKMILPEKANDTTAVQMFLDEARLAASLNHQNVAQVFEVGEETGMHFLAMEYVHGQDLRALLAKAGSTGTRVPVELALTIVAGAASGLHHAHERRTSDGVPMGIVHRDVSPSNLMVGYDGAVKLLDFGIAKATMRSIETQSGIIKGKFAYMSPEQCRGREVDARSDVFSLGILLYEVTTQHRCFRADSDFDTMHRIVTGDIVRPTRLVPGYPQALEAIVMKGLAVDAHQRYQSAGELLEAIEGFAMAARMSLSTMALGRFMRELFGEVPEPWLTSGRVRQPTPAKEHTISNTNGTGTGGPPQVRGSQPLARHDEAPLHLPSEPLDSGTSLGTTVGTGLGTTIGTMVGTRLGTALEMAEVDELIEPPSAAAIRAGDSLSTADHARAEESPSEASRKGRAHAMFATAATEPADPRVSSSSLAAMAQPSQAAPWPQGSQPIPPPMFGHPAAAAARASQVSMAPLSPEPGTGSGVSMVPGAAGTAGVSRIAVSELGYPRYESGRVARQPVPSNRWLYVALAVVLAGIVVLVLVSLRGSPPEAVPAPAPPLTTTTPPPPVAPAPVIAVAPVPVPPPPAPAPPPIPTSITLKISSTPSKADVLLAGTPIGTTPLEIPVPKRKAGFAPLTIHRTGFQDVTRMIDLSADYTNDFKLTAINDEPLRPTPPRPPQQHETKQRPTPAPPPPPTAAPARRCQPPDRINPFDTSCGGKACPPCGA
jgi:serine/threonine protein kinase